MRVLRRYQRMAQQEHFCDHCRRFIQPGEQYEGTVSVVEKNEVNRIFVTKCHIFPSCDGDDPYEWEMGKEDLSGDLVRSAA